MPTFDLNNLFTEIKERHRTPAIKHVIELLKYPEHIKWDTEGILYIDNNKTDLNLRELLPLTFYGSRKNRSVSENQYFQKLQQLGIKIGNKSHPTTRIDRLKETIGNNESPEKDILDSDWFYVG